MSLGDRSTPVVGCYENAPLTRHPTGDCTDVQTWTVVPTGQCPRGAGTSMRPPGVLTTMRPSGACASTRPIVVEYMAGVSPADNRGNDGVSGAEGATVTCWTAVTSWTGVPRARAASHPEPTAMIRGPSRLSSRRRCALDTMAIVASTPLVSIGPAETTAGTALDMDADGGGGTSSGPPHAVSAHVAGTMNTAPRRLTS